MHEVVVFIGPSLEAETAKKILDAEYRPPASRDDIFRAAQEVLGRGKERFEARRYD